MKHLVPIFEEGSVDEDLLNEGNRRLRDYSQRLGYFDVKVDHQLQVAGGRPGGHSLYGAVGPAQPRGKSLDHRKPLLLDSRR